jgi:DNA-3-methyladenine glycosylase I
MRISTAIFLMTKSNLSKSNLKALKVSKGKKTYSTSNHSESPSSTSQQIPWYIHFTKNDSLYEDYMANEWGYEKRGDVALFEKLCLEGAQSGLSWRTILNKRQAYRSTFYNFDIERVSKMTKEDIDAILLSENSGNDIVVRHRGKIESVVNNAKCILTMSEREEGYTSFSDYLWSFVEGKPILNAWKEFNDIPSKSTESEAMSKALKKHGFKYVGSTTCYSLMQSCGFVIDHPFHSPEWRKSYDILKQREDGFHDRR